MSDYPMLISNKLHSFRNFRLQTYIKIYDLYAYIMKKKSLLLSFYFYFSPKLNCKTDGFLYTRKDNN